MASSGNADYKETSLAIATGFVILFLIFEKSWMPYVSMVVGLIGLFSPTLGKMVHWGWMQFAKALGFVNSRILLGLVFFVILFPLSLLYRLTNKDHLNLKPGKASYFKERNHLFTKKDLENPW